ncbi:MAG TPA: diguanylate cyclase [Gallionella sp.]|nr:diguanylate cyclase [Gallionella sp.]
MNGNILIVDDDSGALTLLRNILTAAGYTVRPFNNGELALRSAAAEAPELVLLDIRMPVMDGFEVCRKLKENPALTEIPVIFISSATDIEDKVKGFQAGGIDYITKPFQTEEVIARVNTHVSLSRSRQQMQRAEEALRKSEESLKMAQAIAHVGHWEWDMHSGQSAWSDETYRILGLDPQAQQPSHDAFIQAIHPDDRTTVSSHINRVLEGGEFDVEYRITLPNGSVRNVHSRGRVVCLGGGREARILGTIQVSPEPGQVEMLGVIQDVTERKELELKLEQQASTDPLTGCANRRRFMEMADQEFTRTRRYGGAMSFLMFDLDHFKETNDKYGHLVGDAVLRKLTEVCRGILREVDVIGRIGGDEFGIVLPETGGKQAVEVAERLCQAAAIADVPVENDRPLHFTISIGVASLLPDDSNFAQLIGRGDAALYEAKNSGRNKVSACRCIG